jgi:hypothetical protein
LRKQAEQAAPQQERQSQIRYETALQTLGRSQCLSCERSLSRSDGQLPNFCMHWGLQIHCDCPRCNHHHLSFFPYCPACGLAASTVELTGWGGVTLKISGGHEAIEYMKRYLPRPLDLDVRQECGLRLTAQIPLQKSLAPEMILTALLLIASAR